jgi:hypothetical protein
MNEATIRTWNMLPSLGFQPDSEVVFSDICPRLTLDFGNLKLSAAAVVSPHSGETVLFSGILATRDTVAEVQFELPRRVESLKQCAAWIVWNLDQHSSGGTFNSARDVPWIHEARQNHRLLPWLLSQAEFDARPQCTVRRDWLRLGLKHLREQLDLLPDNTIVVFSFDGAVFSISSESKVIAAFLGEGLPWTVCFRVEAKTLRRQPRRFTREHIGVSVWESQIRFDSWSFEGAVGLPGGGSHSEIH